MYMYMVKLKSWAPGISWLGTFLSYTVDHGLGYYKSKCPFVLYSCSYRDCTLDELSTQELHVSVSDDIHVHTTIVDKSPWDTYVMFNKFSVVYN